jgi:hypothetical protein
MAQFSLFDLGSCGCPLTTYTFNATGCNSSVLQNASVTVTNGVTNYTCTTNSSGVGTVNLPPGPCTFSAAASRFVTLTGSFTVAVGSPQTVSLAFSSTSGGLCRATCVTPILKTITVHLPAPYGPPPPIPIVYNGSTWTGSGSGWNVVWDGASTFTVNGGGGFTLTFTHCTGGAWSIRFTSASGIADLDG